jgi:hypothetical protein
MGRLFTFSRSETTFFIQRSEFSLGIKPPQWAPYYYREFAHNLLDIGDRLELPEGTSPWPTVSPCIIAAFTAQALR